MHFSIGQGGAPPDVPFACNTSQQNCPVPSLLPRTGIRTHRHWHYGIASGGLFATATVACLRDFVRGTYWLRTRDAQDGWRSSC